MTFWQGSGSADPYYRLMALAVDPAPDPNQALYVSGSEVAQNVLDLEHCFFLK